MRWGGHGGFDYSFEDDGKWKISNSKEGKDRKRREMIKIMYFVFCGMRRTASPLFWIIGFTHVLINSNFES